MITSILMLMKDKIGYFVCMSIMLNYDRCMIGVVRG